MWTNPHSQVYLDVTDKSGKIVHWAVETNSPAILTRAGWTKTLPKSLLEFLDRLESFRIAPGVRT